ncbi:MAG: M4 family metallopeptidase [Verrucomicrobiae bacterium]|nr:M4 family metallopeptidase [Verrucomicrobiae bacterium]
MKRQLLIPIAILTLMGILISVSSHKRSNHDETRADFSANSTSGSSVGNGLPPVIPNGGKGIRSAITPEPYSPFQAELDRAMREALAAHQQKVVEVGRENVPMLPISSESHPEHLLPRQQPLNASQRKALAKLRLKTAGKYVDYRTGPEHSSISFLRGRGLEPAADTPEATVSNFLRNNRELLRIDDASGDTVLHSTDTDGLGYTQMRYTTAYKGLEVWPSSFTVQLDPSGDVGLMTGAYAPTPDGLNTEPSVAQEDAGRAAIMAVGASPLSPRESGTLKVFAPVSEPDPKLAWQFAVHSGVAQHWDVFVDAHSGEVLHKQNRYCTAHVQGSGVDSVGQAHSINLWQHNDGGFYMVDTTKPMYQADVSNPPVSATGGIFVYEVVEANLTPQGSLVDWSFRPSVSGSANSGFSPALVAASANVGFVYDYFLERFNRNSFDGRGGSILVYGDIPNYFNAAFAHEQNTMVIGDTLNWAESLDVMCHEMTHGIVGTSAGLVYMDQSGALNESFADIIGESVETFRSGKAFPDWITGSLLPKGYQRSLSSPSSNFIDGAQTTPYPDRMSKFLITEDDHGGVHLNSSIHNHAFYQLVAGLSQHISLKDGLDIFYRALTTKLNKNSGFVDSRLACIASADELFGAGSTQSRVVGLAFDAVEIFDQAGSPVEAPLPTVAANDSTLFTFPSGLSHFLGRRDETFGDPSAGVFLGNNNIKTPAAPNKRPSVQGDGQRGIFVTPDFDAALVDTMNGASTPFGLSGRVESVAISGDGSSFALVVRDGLDPAKKIFVYDGTIDQSKVFVAAQPASDDGGTGREDSIIVVDSLDLSPAGNVVFYDAITRIEQASGYYIDNWATYGIDVNGGQIFSIFPPIPGVNIGNPTIGQTRSNLLTFDVQDEGTGVYSIYAADLATGNYNQLWTLSAGASIAPGWPGYNGDDSAIVFTDYNIDTNFEPLLVAIPLNADGITAPAPAQVWLRGSFPNLGTIYRRGSYQGMPQVSAMAVSSTASETPGNPGRFRLNRTGSTAAPLGVTFTLTGSAQNGTDISPFPFSATIPAGSSSVDLTMLITDDAISEGDETATLTVLDRSDYLCAGQPATVLIKDNDAGASGFAAWATSNGVLPTALNGNPDGDSWSNIMEYALGLNPKKPDGRDAIRATVVGGRLVLEVVRSLRSDLTYQVEFSSNMKSWTSQGSTVLVNSPTTLKVQANAGAAFGRLRVSQ